MYSADAVGCLDELLVVSDAAVCQEREGPGNQRNNQSRFPRHLCLIVAGKGQSVGDYRHVAHEDEQYLVVDQEELPFPVLVAKDGEDGQHGSEQEEKRNAPRPRNHFVVGVLKSPARHGRKRVRVERKEGRHSRQEKDDGRYEQVKALLALNHNSELSLSFSLAGFLK